MGLKIKETISIKSEKHQKLVSVPVSLIEEFKKKDQILNNIVAKHKTLVKLSGDGIITINLKGFVISANPAFFRLTGFSKDEITGKHFSKLPTRKNAIYMPAFLKMFKSLLLGKTINDLEFIYKRKDGKFRNALARGSLFKSNGKVSGVQMILTDITERKIIKDDLIESDIRYRNLIKTSPDGIIVLNIKSVITLINPAFTKLTGYSEKELVGKHFLKLPTRAAKVSVYLKAFQEVLRGGKLSTLKLPFKRKNGEICLTECKYTVLKKNDSILELHAICRDITMQEKLNKELKESYLKLKKTFSDTIEALSAMSESWDPYTAGHQKRVTRLAVAVSREMGLDKNIIKTVKMAALIHDIGKINVPSSILTKPGKISDIEFDMAKLHPKIGYEILKNINFPYPIADIILQHHEKLDGSGYPKGLKEKDITFEAKILAVCDVVEAMSSNRPYRPALGLNEAIKEIALGKGKIYDSAIVDSCLKVLKEMKLSLFDH